MSEEQKERLWDFTSMNTFQTCRKKYYYRMVKHLVPVTTAPALAFGKALHSALEHFYIEINAGKARSDALNTAIRIFGENYTDVEGEDRRTTANAEKLLRGYEEVYRNEPFKVIAQEVGFAVPVYYGKEGKSFMLCGRLDALVDWNGVLYVLEHKTTSVLGGSYFYQFAMNMQVDGYIYGAEEHTGRKCYGAVINALEVWKDVKRETAKTKKLEDHYARDPQSRSVYEIEEYKNDTGMLVEDILEAEKTGRFYRNKSNCFTYNYKCPYWDLCKYGDDERFIESHFKVEPWEPYKQINGGGE